MSHGPCGPTYHFCPDRLGDGLTLDGRLKIAVIDDLVKTLERLTRRLIWRTIRDRALERWELAGLKFIVSEGPGLDFTWDDYVNTKHVIPGAIRIVRDSSGTGMDAALYDNAAGGSVVAISPDREWWKRYYRGAAIGLTGHEVGHCLGLDHGGGGIMAGNWRPNEHDIESVRSYFH